MNPEQPFQRVIFDCDSTLSRIEGVDELSAAHRDEIARLTAEAMSGRVPLEEVYGRRLELIRPLRNDVATVGRLYIENAVPHAREVVQALKSLGKEVRVVSGGLRLAVVTFAGWLGLRDEQVHAVKVYFDTDNRHKAFDAASPLVRSGGKRAVVEGLPSLRTAFVGDGITDAEVRGAADCFVCFGGVVLRPEVAATADAVVRSESLAGVLPVLCTADELAKLRRDPRLERLMAAAANA